MIMRTWHGKTKLEDGDAYEKFMIERAAPDYSRINGLERLYFTRRDEGDFSHFLLVTLWASMEDVEQFAGSDPSVAKYYPEDDKFLIDRGLHSHNRSVFYEAP